ncbi:MAG TPA: FtsX-like permease family protein [Dyella sp.]|uniref:ABC transporter permease n=1 Tax=Dyella sp. TaxID=1869338 RepID=UPI002D765BAD|nr:FtsX-like permease family protein [Dyella sp.]HET6554981.1 FtsX-like permease family protein [Dyella sp.]
MAFSRAFMQLRPIVSALGRHKVATLLIVLQVALTLAVASNALFMVATRMVHLSRSTGTDEAHLFVMRSSWAMGLTAGQIDANIRADLDALRHVAGVRDVIASNSYPLGGNVAGMLTTRLKLTMEQATRPQFAMVYAADEHAIDTLGVSLIAGRNFRSDEISTIGPNDKLKTPGIIVTRDLADKLFPDGSALGRTVFLPGGPSAIIGIVADLQGPLSITRSSDADSVLIPARYIDPDVVIYLVRTDGSATHEVMGRAMQALQQRPGLHVIDPKLGMFAMDAVREQAYATDQSVATLMSIVCGLLLLATAGGIVGLSSFWVSQRRRQIGIRRSLGATSGDILRYFHAENFLIVSSGIVLGIALAVLANSGLMKMYELPRMPFYVPLLGALLLWLIGQLAVWGPARHAAKVAPVVAIRTT